MTDSPLSDIDALDSLESSEGWALVKARIDAEIERGRDYLERGTSEVEYTRGELASLRTVLALPGILRDELKADLKEQDV